MVLSESDGKFRFEKRCWNKYAFLEYCLSGVLDLNFKAVPEPVSLTKTKSLVSILVISTWKLELETWNFRSLVEMLKSLSLWQIPKSWFGKHFFIVIAVTSLAAGLALLPVRTQEALASLSQLAVNYLVGLPEAEHLGSTNLPVLLITVWSEHHDDHASCFIWYAECWSMAES